MSDDLSKQIEAQMAAVQAARDAITSVPPPAGNAPANNWQQPWSPSLVLSLAAMLLIFTLIVMYMMYRLLRKDQAPEGVLRIFGIPLIIITAVLLVIVGFGEQQIAPVMGLLGTVAGYLLGRNTATVPRDPDPAPTPSRKPGSQETPPAAAA